MQIVATNIRFNKSEYDEIKRISQSNGKSIASFIREAIRDYKENYLKSKAKRKKLFELIAKSSVKIDMPVVDLVHEGRRFE